MKFQHLNIGQAFEYQGEMYIKDGPLMALQQSTGKKVLIPRSADLLIKVQTATATQEPLPDSYPSKRVLDAFAEYEQHCLQSFEQIAADISSDKRHHFLAQLKLAGEMFYRKINGE